MKLFGVTGWKNSGKTGLIARLVTEFSARGLTVSTIKHAHHSFDVDQEGRDSYRHREAGAKEVLLSSANRWALMHEARGEEEASLNALLAKLSPVDLVLVEGFKTEPHSKIEAHRGETGQSLIAPNDSSIKALASDSGVKVEGRPTFHLDDTKAIADFIWDSVSKLP
ncbi:MAG: molybdopterin-guanine dinucleotide biosynthesis protein B [Pseudomonadota bacterium]